MTLTAVFAAKDFAVAVADRRRTNLATTEHIDDVLKIHRLNANVMSAFAGIYLPTIGGFRGAAEALINENAWLMDDTKTVEDAAEIYSKSIVEKLNSGTPREDLEVTFHFAGLGRSRRSALARVSYLEEFKPVVTQSNENGLIWGLSRADYCPSYWLESNIASMQEISVGSVQRLAMRLAEHTAQRDGYVSGTFDMLTLER